MGLLAQMVLGKSTFLKILGGEIEPNTGEVSILLKLEFLF